MPASRHHDAARVGPRRLLDGNVEAILRQPRRGALRPLDNDRAFAESIIETELLELVRLHAIEVAMAEREVRQLVTLYQRESRARHFGRAAEPGDERAREGRLAGAERPRELDDIAGFEHQREPGRDDAHPRDIGLIETPTRGHPARLVG